MAGLTNGESYDDGLRRAALDRGLIMVMGDIDDFGATTTILEIEDCLSRQLSTIEVRLMSPGGGVNSALGLRDALLGCGILGVQVTVKVVGYAASAASMIVLQGASVGRRVATPNSRLHLHEPSTWIEVPTKSGLKDAHTECDALNTIVCTILSERTNHSVDEVNRFFERKEVWLSAQEALAWKLIDCIEY